MSDRHLPVRPNLDQLKHQAKDLLRAIKRGDPGAAGICGPIIRSGSTPRARLADAQLVLARSYGVRELAAPRARLPDDRCDLARRCRRRPRAGAAASGAAARRRARREGQLGAADVVCREPRARPHHRDAPRLGATDVQFAFDRACLQGELDTARLLHGMGARPVRGVGDGPVRNAERRGSGVSARARRRDQRRARRPARARGDDPRDLRPPSRGQAPVPRARGRHGIELPTRRRWPCTAAGSICSNGNSPATPGCCPEPSATRRLRASDEAARLLLDHGADPNRRASLRKRLRFVDDETMHEYRGVSSLGWGERFHDQGFVSRPAMRLIASRGGQL